MLELSKNRISKKIIFVLLIVILEVGCFSNLIYAEFEFTDVSKEYWGYQYIYSMANAGAIKGYPDGTFKPENPVTRAEYCVMTILAAGMVPGNIDSNKKQWEIDYIDNEHWANDYMKSMFYYTSDYGKWYLLNNVQPDDYISRAEAAMGLYEIINDFSRSMTGYEEEVKQILSEKYVDYDQFGNHTEAIYFANQEGIINGYPDGTFKPSNPVTRAEMCAMLYKIYSKEIEENISEYGHTLKWFNSFILEVDRDVYYLYRAMNNRLSKINGTPYLTEEDLKKRINANAGDTLIQDIIAKLEEGANDNTISLSKQIIKFVQEDISYLNDPNERDYAKFPYETIYDGGGDCEDKAILMCSLLKNSGYDVCLVVFSDHVGLGVTMKYDIKDGYYYRGRNDKKYYYLETTAPDWEPGELPDKYTNEPATLLYP